jgi:hypothetical protein
MPIPARVPAYEYPIARFLAGRGSIELAHGGGAFTLGEALLYFPADEYPIIVEGTAILRGALVWRAVDIFASGNDWLLIEGMGREPTERLRMQLIEEGWLEPINVQSPGTTSPSPPAAYRLA